MSAHDEIDAFDGDNEIEIELSPSKNPQHQDFHTDSFEVDDTEEQRSCQDIFFWLLKFTIAQQTVYKWKGIDIDVHGFLIVFVIIDIVYFTIANIGTTGSIFLGIPYSLFRNAALISIVVFAAWLRLKLFASKQLEANTNLPSNLVFSPFKGDLESNNVEEEKSTTKLAGREFGSLSGMGMDQMIDEPPQDEIEVKSVIVTYLGTFVTLKHLCKDKKKQVMYYAFSTVFFLTMSLVFLICGGATNAVGKNKFATDRNTACFRYFWFWLRDAMGWCALMGMLPVPGFDGAAVLTLWMKKQKFGSTSITFSIFMLSAIIVLVAAIIGIIPPFNLFALYVAGLCGLKLIQFTCDPKNEDMKALKTMAKTAKKANDAGIILP